MKAQRIRLAIAENIPLFFTLMRMCPCEVDIEQGRRKVNGKSIGVFSLDLSAPLTVIFYGEIDRGLGKQLKSFRID